MGVRYPTVPPFRMVGGKTGQLKGSPMKLRAMMICTAIGLYITGCSGPSGPEDSCNSSALAKEINRNGQHLLGLDLPDSARVIRPGDAVTRDHRPDRANIYLDRFGMVVRVTCG